VFRDILKLTKGRSELGNRQKSMHLLDTSLEGKVRSKEIYCVLFNSVSNITYFHE